jgi:hypothetical protein
MAALSILLSSVRLSGSTQTAAMMTPTLVLPSELVLYLFERSRQPDSKAASDRHARSE